MTMHEDPRARLVARTDVGITAVASLTLQYQTHVLFRDACFHSCALRQFRRLDLLCWSVCTALARQCKFHKDDFAR